MKQLHDLASVFQRVREHRRQGLQFTPTPARPAGLELPRMNASELGLYATPMQFAGLTGISVTEIASMLEAGVLTHIRLSLDGPLIHVGKGLADLGRLERGPAVGPT